MNFNRKRGDRAYMEITHTINADKRYYIDENLIINPGSLIDTEHRFNDMKIQMYNLLYDKKYKSAGILMKDTYSKWCKDTFKTSDYYNCAVYASASGMLSSQDELNKLYIKTKKSDLDARDTKIASTIEQLEKKQAIKDSLVTYAKIQKWKTPYPGCQTKMTGKSVTLPGSKKVDVDTYERNIEADIRRLKSRLRLLVSARNRAQDKLDCLKTHSPKRIIFGSKKMYTEKDSEDINIETWKQKFFNKRHASMSLPGRHTSKNCNFLVRRASAADFATRKELDGHKEALIITCMDGKEAVLLDFHLSRDNNLWLDALNAKPENRKPVCYNFQLKCDENGRMYFIPSVTMVLENAYCNESFENGCVSIDLNYDHVALTDIDKDGNRISGEVLRFNSENKTSEQISDEIGRIISKVGQYCEDRRKPLVMEDIDTTISKHGMKYGNAKGNRHASVFAYRKMEYCIENQSYRRSFGIIKINPAYTSQIGKILYMRRLGISIHEAASYVIGLKGMGLRDRLIPEEQMAARLTDHLKEELSNGKDVYGLMKIWKYISGKLSGIYTHSFYRSIPYEYKKGDELTKTGKPKKPKSLSVIAAEMKGWTACYY